MVTEPQKLRSHYWQNWDSKMDVGFNCGHNSWCAFNTAALYSTGFEFAANRFALPSLG
jgi:hypothetical protein